jgi:hypothetical protein
MDEHHHDALAPRDNKLGPVALSFSPPTKAAAPAAAAAAASGDGFMPCLRLERFGQVGPRALRPGPWSPRGA